MKNAWMRKALALLLCGVMLCAIGCTPTDDTATTTTTTTAQEAVTTTTIGDVDTDDTTTTVEGVTTTDGNVDTDDTTTKNDIVTTTTKDGVVTTTSTTKNGTTKDNGKVTTTTTKKPTTSTTKKPTTTKPVQTGPKVITCYGDSVTEGMGMGQADKYPTILQTLLGSDYKVQNAGDGGEKTQSIMSRQGSLKLYTKKELIFKKNQGTLLIDQGAGRGVITSNGLEVQWTSPFGRDVPINKVTINGVSYKLQFENFDWSNCHCETYLIRENTSKPVTIPAGSEVILEIAQISKTNYCDIYFMGFNGDWKTIDELIAQYQQMVDYRNDDNYLVVIPFWDKVKNAEAYTKFKAAFGDHALDLVQYCVDGGMTKLGLSVTTEDQECLNNGILPYSLKLYGSNNKGDVHLSAKGYKVLANALHEQGKKINLW